MLRFEDGTIGLALNLDEDTIGAVVLGNADSIQEGQFVEATGEILSVPVGDGMIGRVVNMLGEVIYLAFENGSAQIRHNLELEKQPAGIYLIRLKVDGRVKISKLDLTR